MPGKEIIGLLWSSLNVWRPSKFSFRDFYQLSIPIWNCGIIKLRAWQRDHRALRVEFKTSGGHRKFHLAIFISYLYPSKNVWRLSNYFYLEVFYPSTLWTTWSKKFLQNSRPGSGGSTVYRPVRLPADRWVEILNDAKDEFEVDGASAVFST